VDGLLLTLPLLALVDSTSFGTLLIPLWLMTSRQVLVRQHLLYLAVVGASYWVLGLALAFGLAAVWEDLRELTDRPAAHVAQLVAGLALVAYALLPQRWRPRGSPGRAARWRDQQLRHGASARPIVVLAVVAVGLEALTMLPYLAAVALITAADVSAPVTVALLLGYCLVMVAPALVLLALRRLAARRVERVLASLERLTARGGTEATLWAAFVVGALVSWDAGQRLDLIGG
jgi:hypothetical protein